MTTYSAKSTVGWRKSEIRDLMVAGAIGVISWGLWATQTLPDFAGLWLGLAIVFSAVFLLGAYFNLTRKRNVTLFAEMNTEGWQVRWWGRKPLKSVWGDRLSPLYNSGSLNDVKDINLAKVGIHTVFEFRLPSGKLTLPERLANTDGVRDFLLAWVESNGGRIKGTSRESVEAFVAVLNRGRGFAEDSNKIEDEPETASTAPSSPVAEEAEPVAVPVVASQEPGGAAKS